MSEPVVIHGDDLDIERIQDAIRQRVSLRVGHGSPVARTEVEALRRAQVSRLADWNFPNETWEAMWPPRLTLWNLDEDFPVRSHRPGFGTALVWFKRRFRALLRVLTRPLLTQQVDINRAFALMLHTLSEEAATERLHRHALEQRLGRLNALLRELRGENEPLVVFAEERIDSGRALKLAVVVQRYGDGVAGGAELHARYIAEMLARRHDVTVLTTNARDYVTWAPHDPAGESTLDGVRVLRFPVERERNPQRFAAAAALAFAPDHAIADEQRYHEEQGPYAPGLWRHLEEDSARYDALVAFSYRYVTSYRAALAFGKRTLLVPTAEKDPAVGLRLSHDLFRSVGAIAYNSIEERAMIEAAAGNQSVPGDVVGIGSRIPERTEAKRFRDAHGVDGPYVLYVGRIDRNKGCPELFDFFASFIAETALPHSLLLIGSSVLPIPSHPRIRHLGFLSDRDKFDALSGAEALLMPSDYESLSMVILEAMALGVPPLVNGRCDVLRGQIRRSNAGLYYDNYEEFFEACLLLLATPRLRELLGGKGRGFYLANYTLEVIAEKYERLLDRIAL